ncbi:MAG: hypothetical protein ACREPT_01120 [Rudaea sp.]
MAEPGSKVRIEFRNLVERSDVQAELGVFKQRDADRCEELQRIASAPAAKTRILVAELNRLFVAASPGDTKAMAAVLIFGVGTYAATGFLVRACKCVKE